MVKYLLLIMLVATPTWAATTQSVCINTESPYEVENTVLLMLIGANRETTLFDFLSIRKQKNIPQTIEYLKDFEQTAIFKLHGKEADFRIVSHTTALIAAAQKFDIDQAIKELRKTNTALINIKNTLFMTLLFMQDKKPIKGTFELSYTFPYYVQETNTTVCVTLNVKMMDNQLYVETHLRGKMQSLTYACLRLTATEHGEESTIETVLTATTNRGKCIGKRVVSRVMSRLMCQRLSELINQGQELEAAGLGPTPAIMTKQFIENISKHGLRE